MNFKFVSVICLIFGSVIAKEVTECNDENKDQFDRYMMELTTFGDPNGKYPSNQKELANQCRKDREKVNWSIAYTNKCLHGIPQELMIGSMRDLNRTINKYCESPRLSKLYISWSDCGNKALNQTVRCWQYYVAQLDRINLEKESIVNADKGPIICCTHHEFDHCLDEAFHSQGEGICPEQIASGLHSMLNEVAGSSVDIFCGDYAADNDKCDAIHKKYIRLKDIKFHKSINKSPINPFIEIVSTADIVLNMKSSSDQSSENVTSSTLEEVTVE